MRRAADALPPKRSLRRRGTSGRARAAHDVERRDVPRRNGAAVLDERRDRLERPRDERDAGLPDLLDREDERLLPEGGEVHEEAAGVRRKGLLGADALLEDELPRRFVGVARARLLEDEREDRLVEVVAAEARTPFVATTSFVFPSS